MLELFDVERIVVDLFMGLKRHGYRRNNKRTQGIFSKTTKIEE